MLINKKLLTIALSISCYQAVISMEQEQLELKKHADNLSHYMSDKNSETRKQNILPFAQWITEKRATFSVDNNWKAFCQNNHTLLKFTIGAIPICKVPGMENIAPTKIIDVIMDRAYTLQPDSTAEALTDSIDQDLLVLYHACFKS